MAYKPNLDGGSNTATGIPVRDGGGASSSPSSNLNIDLSQLTVTGGLTGIIGSVIVFGTTLLFNQPLGWIFDTTDFNCEEDCEYHFRVEEIEVYRQPTIDKVIIRYRDLGQVTVNVFFVGNVLGDSKVSKIVTVVFGGKADGKIYTTSFDLTCTFEAPQLIITRNAFSGPLSITKVLVEFVEGDTKPI